MSNGLSREVLKWILSLDLSYPVKNPKRDFANGFLYAEILSRYYPADVQMHSFENVASMDRKKSNWSQLEKVIKRKRIPIERGQIEAVIAADGDAAVEVLQAIHSFIHSPSYEASKAQGSPERPDAGHGASPSGQDYIPMPDPYQQQAALYGQGAAAMYFGGGAMQQHQQQAAMYGQGEYGMQQQQQAMNAAYAAYGANGGYAGGGAAGQGQYGAAAGYGGYGYGMQQQQAMQQQQQQYGGQVPQQLPPVQRQASGYGGGYAAQKQQQQQQGARAPSGRSVSPGRGGARQGAEQGAAQGAAQDAAAYSAAYAMNYAEQMRQQAAAAGYTPDQQQLVYQQALYQYQQQAAAMAEAGGGGGGGGAAGPSGRRAGQEASPEREGLPYSRKPRAVEFKPYEMKDFADKDYNVKKAGYFQLGKLGPDLETEELQAKREAKERIKRMAEQVREENARKAAAAAASRQRTSPGPPARASPSRDGSYAAINGGAGSGAASGGEEAPAPAQRPGVGAAVAAQPAFGGGRGRGQEPSARDRALQFARNIPKPEVKPKKAAAAGQGDGGEEAPPLSELEQLERQHAERQQEVDRIRAELARVL